MAIKALKPVRTGMSGPAMTQICAARTAYGAYVARVASGTAQGAPWKILRTALDSPPKTTTLTSTMGFMSSTNRCRLSRPGSFTLW